MVSGIKEIDGADRDSLPIRELPCLFPFKIEIEYFPIDWDQDFRTFDLTRAFKVDVACDGFAGRYGSGLE